VQRIAAFISSEPNQVRALAELSNVGKTPAQRHRDNQKYGDHTEISELLSNGRTLPHLYNPEISPKIISARMIARRLSKIAHSEPAGATATSQLNWLRCPQSGRS
jgi:hypothetical protein